MVEDEASIREVGECEGAEAEELEGVEVGLGVAQGGEVRLELLEMVEVVALSQYRQDMLV